MTNAEKYKEEIRNQSKGRTIKCAVYRVRQPHRSSCFGICDDCKFDSIEWLMQEYEEPSVDWNKVKPGTKFVYPCKPNIFFPDGIAKKKFAFYVNDVIWVMGGESGEVYPLTNVDISTIELRDWKV